MVLTRLQLAEADRLSDTELVDRARARDELAVRAITKRYNRRLFRLARSILRDDAEVEDVVQESYVRAFTGLDLRLHRARARCPGQANGADAHQHVSLRWRALRSDDRGGSPPRLQLKKTGNHFPTAASNPYRS
jgi:hypothetical protein